MCVTCVCVFMCLHASTPVSVIVFASQIQLFNISSANTVWLFYVSPLISPSSLHSFVYYLIRRGSQRLGGGGGWVAIVSQRGRHNYVLLQTHRERESGHVWLYLLVPSQEHLLAPCLGTDIHSQEITLCLRELTDIIIIKYCICFCQGEDISPTVRHGNASFCLVCF